MLRLPRTPHHWLPRSRRNEPPNSKVPLVLLVVRHRRRLRPRAPRARRRLLHRVQARRARLASRMPISTSKLDWIDCASLVHKSARSLAREMPHSPIPLTLLDLLLPPILLPPLVAEPHDSLRHSNLRASTVASE